MFVLTFLLRVGEIRRGGGSLAKDLCKCFSNSISSYNPLARNTHAVEDEDDDVAKERATVSQYWEQTNKPDDLLVLAHNLRKEFKKRKQKTTKVAVKNVTFHISEGQVFGLLGPNGAGKTSTINMLIAEYAPTAGQVSCICNTVIC